MSEFVDFVNKNSVLEHNPPTGLDMHITERGSDWLWAVFAVFGVLLILYVCLFFYAELKGSRLTRYSLAPVFLITLFEFFGYYIYASNLGWTGIQAEFNNVSVDPSITGETPGVRQIFYAKYIAWFLSWPCLLFLLELAGMSTGDNHNEVSAMDLIHSLLVQIVGTEFWVVSILIASLIHSTYKWGPWVFGAVTMLIVQAIIVNRQFFVLKTKGITGCLTIIELVVVWLYFICWGLSEGGNKIQNDGEAVFYGILDLCTFAIFPGCLLFIIGHCGKWPKFCKGHEVEEEETYEKESAPNSVRASGETAVPHQEENAVEDV
ncbi:hypothetical protein KAFR_0D01640 [Kazachstania africana CBS 2517]|uniref:30 kDa heat shock protein n=1 Tax=Kazachstania africana (strain ATCC 22294 / BCRC 22015 / CBS 2517 / CECT 1963 / NBRC 1671 / NRRL Y-8276) TaxID=1071382 RepID=H2ATW0_KAZAF|nr:hypothetical protein KAFR_0D01640 [Kazachstania africana CBS 2517]CCF57810.1 hypothetical protein KAFR_0D01640 [Kazachstania africana CBS 2517]